MKTKIKFNAIKVQYFDNSKSFFEDSADGWTYRAETDTGKLTEKQMEELDHLLRDTVNKFIKKRKL